MKHFFSYNYPKSKYAFIWVIFYVYVFVQVISQVILKNPDSDNLPLLLGGLFLSIGLMLLLSFFYCKYAVNYFAWKETPFEFTGRFGAYIGRVVLGLLLSIITLGIYFPWYARSITSYVLGNSKYKGESFEFLGKGSKLFVFVLLAGALPMLVLSIAYGAVLTANPAALQAQSWIFLGLVYLCIIPLLYLQYKWYINFRYKDYQIVNKSDFWQGCGMILGQVLLMIITVGIYSPVAVMRIFKMYAETTTMENATRKFRFGYDLDTSKVFLFFWGQSLLTIITLGIYSPWAFAKVCRYIASKTYVEEVQ